MGVASYRNEIAHSYWIGRLIRRVGDGTSASCDDGGVWITRGAARTEIAYARLSRVSLMSGWLWHTIVFRMIDGRCLKVGALPKKAATTLYMAVLYNQTTYVRTVAASLEKPLSDADSEVRSMLSCKRYIPTSRLERLRSFLRVLSPLFCLDIWPKMLPPDQEKKIKRVAGFLADCERQRNILNARFEEVELKRLSTFFDSLESHPLTLSQRRAIIVNEDRNLVVAGAGSGKTSVLIGKVRYLVVEKLRSPSEILMLAYSRDAAEGMSDRLSVKIGESIATKTFHSLGAMILRHVEPTGWSLAECATDEHIFRRVVGSFIEKAINSDSNLASIFLTWFQSEFAPYRSRWEFNSLEEYESYIRENEIRTLKGEKVRSFEECEIANWLYLSGIGYSYETPYEHPTATETHTQYRPDFYLPDYGVYIEHFAIDRNLKTPPFIPEQRYLEAMQWKRETHQRHGTTLVETYSYEKSEGTLLGNLHSKLKAKLGVTFETSPMPIDEALETLRVAGRFNSFSALMAKFLRHYKNNRIEMEELRSRASSARNSERAKAFVEIFSAIFERYQAWLLATNQIDFEDMIVKASEYVISGKYKSPFGYILVDEFQDISVSRAALLKALLSQRPDSQLFCVGDDWQSIYRFAGSDISLMREFAENFGSTMRVDLEENFRCVDRVADAASKFVLRNEAQIKKTVKATVKARGSAIFIRYFENRKTFQPSLKGVLRKIVNLADGRNVKVRVVGRYTNTQPKKVWGSLIRAFPTLKLEYSTVHAAKGYEADYVIVLGLGCGRFGFPTGMSDDPLLNLVLSVPEPFPHAEERRLFYVALTRAKQAVFLLADKNSPSPFAVELERGGYDVEVLSCLSMGTESCPLCKDGKLIVRSGDFGEFVACNAYPRCRYTAKLCPTCREGIVRERGTKIECTFCNRESQTSFGSWQRIEAKINQQQER